MQQRQDASMFIRCKFKNVINVSDISRPLVIRNLYYNKCYSQDLLFEPFVSHETQYEMRIVDAQNCVCVYFTSSVFACLCKYTTCYVNV